jgi:hypothetical protein
VHASLQNPWIRRVGRLHRLETAHRPKRSPPKKGQAAVIAGPAIVTSASKRTHRQVPDVVVSDEPSAIVTAKNPRRRGSPGEAPDITPEEHKRRGDAADALFRELVRQATGKRPPSA